MGVPMVSDRVRAGTAVWLYATSTASLILGLVCAESISFRSFWPEFCTIVSLGLLLTALIHTIDRRMIRQG
jgi:hypothetical protein